MEKSDKVFLLALAYTATTEKALDHSTFLEKVKENEKVFSKLQKPSKLRTMERSKLGV